MTVGTENPTTELHAVPDLDATSAATRQLAAVQAALDPDRDYARHNILLSIIAEALLDEPLTCTQLRNRIQASWATTAVTVQMLDKALAVGRELQMLEVRVIGSTDEPRFALREAAASEAQHDMAWAASIFDQFESEVGHRLSILMGHTLSPEQVSFLAHALFVAVTEMAEKGSRPVTHLRGDLQSPSIDAASVVASMKAKRVYDVVSRDARRRLSQALPRLVAAVLDPGDAIGSDILGSLLAGIVLRGMLLNRDVGVAELVAGTRIALDTSALVPTAEEGSAARAIFDELVRRSLELGVSIVVFEHTLEEYGRLWSAGAEEIASLGEQDLARLSTAPDMISHPFMAEFARQRADNPRLTWQRFAVGRRDPVAGLRDRGITVVVAADYDHVFASDMENRLLALSRDPNLRSTRSLRAAQADATSCAAIHAWRAGRQDDPPIAWFVANDTLTQRAFAELADDAYPLVASPEAWLMYITRLGDGDPAVLRPLAAALADATRRTSLLTVACAFPVADVVRYAEMLEDEPGSGLSYEDLRRRVQLDFVDFLTTSDSEGKQAADIRQYADKALRDRSRQRDDRSRRALMQAELTEKGIELQLKEAADLARASERAKADLRQAEAQDRVQRQHEEAMAALEAKKDACQNEAVEAEQWRGTRRLRILVLLLCMAAFGWFSWRHLPGRSGAFQTVWICVAVISFAYLWKVLTRQTRIRDSLWELCVTVALVGLEVAIGLLNLGAPIG